MPNVLAVLALMAGASAGPSPQQVQSPGHNPVECYCRAQGRTFAEGETICLKTAEGPRLAQCRMEINVMSWAVTSNPCPET